MSSESTTTDDNFAQEFSSLSLHWLLKWHLRYTRTHPFTNKCLNTLALMLEMLLPSNSSWEPKSCSRFSLEWHPIIIVESLVRTWAARDGSSTECDSWLSRECRRKHEKYINRPSSHKQSILPSFQCCLADCLTECLTDCHEIIREEDFHL